MTPEQVALLTDSRLSDAARVLGLHLSNLPEGEHELPHDKLAALLHGCPNRDTVGRHMRQLEVYEYITRTSPGGKGSPRYRWSARENSREDTALPAKIHGERPVVVVEEEDIPPMSPVVVLHPLTADAEAAIEKHAAILAGCRDSLRDYLRRRVAPPRQSGYVHSIAAKINGLGFNWLGVTMDRRPGLVAAALNELSATDETGYKSPVGDPRNLVQKLQILVQNEVQPRQQRATGTDGGRRSGRKPWDEQDYGEGTTTFPGLNK